jgi:hypothetical protein
MRPHLIAAMAEVVMGAIDLCPLYAPDGVFAALGERSGSGQGIAMRLDFVTN